MTTSHEDPFDDKLAQGIRELDGRESAPDVTDRVLRGEASRLSQPSSSRSLAALLVVSLGLAAAIGVWLRDADPGNAPAMQGARPELPAPVTVRTQKDIEQLPRKTPHVRGFDLAPQDLLALQRVSGLRGLTLRGKLTVAHLEALPRLDKLEQIVFEYELEKPHAKGLTHLAALPRLRSVALAMASIDDSVLAALAKLKKLRSLALQGELVCSKAGMAKFAKARPRLLAFGIVTYRDTTGVVPPPMTPKGVWAELPASLIELKLNDQAIATQTLQRLPRLKRLDLFRTEGPRNDLLKIAHQWRGATIVTPNGFHVQVDKRGKVTPKPRKVVLTRRKDNGAYAGAAYSFLHQSGDVMQHQNYVDLVYNGCGTIHINTNGDSDNKVMDDDGVVGPNQERATTFLESFRPIAGRSYTVIVARKGRGGGLKLFVKLKIEKVEGDTVSLTWHPVDVEQALALKRPGSRARAGTMGQCGGAHGVR